MPNIVNLDQEDPEGYIRDEDVDIDALLYTTPIPTQEEVHKVSIKWGQHKDPTLNTLGVFLAKTTLDYAHRIKASFPLEWSDALDSIGDEDYSLNDLPTLQPCNKDITLSLHELADISNAGRITLPTNISVSETGIAAHVIQCIYHLLNAEYDSAQRHLDILQDLDG